MLDQAIDQGGGPKRDNGFRLGSSDVLLSIFRANLDVVLSTPPLLRLRVRNRGYTAACCRWIGRLRAKERLSRFGPTARTAPTFARNRFPLPARAVSCFSHRRGRSQQHTRLSLDVFRLCASARGEEVSNEGEDTCRDGKSPRDVPVPLRTDPGAKSET